MFAPTKCFGLIQPCNEAFFFHCVRTSVCSVLICGCSCIRGVSTCTRVCVCVFGCMCAGFILASHWVGISPFVLQLIAVNATKRAQPSNFIFGLPALRLNRCHYHLLCCSLCLRNMDHEVNSNLKLVCVSLKSPAANKTHSVDSSRSRFRLSICLSKTHMWSLLLQLQPLQSAVFSPVSNNRKQHMRSIR